MLARTALNLVTIEAARALGRNKLRSALAVLGISVAVAIVIAVVALGRASVKQSEAEFDKLGDNLVWIEAGSRNVAGVRTGTRGSTTLTAHDADAIRREVPLIKEVSENVDGSFLVIYGDRSWKTRWRGVAPSYSAIKRWGFTRGEMFDTEQMERRERVVVIGETVRRELFGDDDPIGQIIYIQSFDYHVIGLLESRGQSVTGQDQDDTVWMPWTTAMQRIVGKDQTWLDDIVCSATSDDAKKPAIAQISAILRENHHIQTGEDDDFNIRHPEDVLAAKLETSRTLEHLLIAIASISLVIGGIGIMNVMLASVSQRIIEIGLRAAVGAPPAAIRLQFLAEAVMLTTLGGGLGILVGELMKYVFEVKLGWLLESSTQISVVSGLAAIATGIVFGMYPAVRASRLDPIAALRNE